MKFITQIGVIIVLIETEVVRLMDLQIKPIIYILISLFLLWQVLRWFVPFLFNFIVSYIQGVVLEGQLSPDDRKRILDYFNYPNGFTPKPSRKETNSEYVDFEEID